MVRYLSLVAIAVFFSSCSHFKSGITAERAKDIALNFDYVTAVIKVQPIEIISVSQKTFDTLHITVQQAKKLVYSQKSKALQEYRREKKYSVVELWQMQTFNRLLNQKEFDYLKRTIAQEHYNAYISNDFLKHSLQLPDSVIPATSDFWDDAPPGERKFHETHTEILFFPLLGDSASLDLYAIVLGNIGAWENYVLFFKKNKLLGYKKIFHHYGIEGANLHATVTGRDTIICFRENFGGGTGVWWYENFFYMLRNDSIVPIQSLIAEGNWSIMPFESYAKYLNLDIIKCNPLIFKASYSLVVVVENTRKQYTNRTIFSDTVFLTYNWSKKQHKFIPKKSNKLDSLQLYAFVSNAQTELWVYAFRNEIINRLQNQENKDWMLWFLEKSLKE